MKLNLGAGPHSLPGFANLDLVDGWRFEDGLGDYEDGSVEGISISHAAMYVPRDRWPFVFSEIARVLERGGVVRITEDATDDRRSPRFGGYHDAVTLTSARLVIEHLEHAGLRPQVVNEDCTMFKDDSLMQSNHGGSPKAFFVEGRKP